MDVTPEHKLKRYLHYTSESGIYVPGNRFTLNCYTPENFTCTEELFNELKGEYILKTVEEVAANKTYLYFDALMFALAYCATRKEASASFRCSVYRIAEKIITEPDHLLLFVKFLKDLSKPKGRYGRGVKRLVTKFYLNKTALELAEVVTTKPRWMGWRHKDLIKLVHISSQDPCKSAVILYTLKGLDAVKNKFQENSEVEEVLSYLSTVDDFRRSCDVTAIARLIESYSLTIKHVNPVVIKEKEVWRALLKQISLTDLLDHFSTLTVKKMFRNGRIWDNEFVKCVCDALGNPASVTASKLHPNEVFVQLYKYKNQATMKLEFKKKMQPTSCKPPPQICTDIVSGLSKLLKASFKNVTPTKKRFFVFIDGGPVMTLTNCGYTRYISPINAATIILLTLLKVEKKVDVYTSGDVAVPSVPSIFTLEPVTIPASLDIDSLFTNLQQVDKGKLDVRKLIQWAKKNKKEYDAFIIIGGYVKVPTAQVIHDELTKYSEATKVQDSRLIVCSLRGQPKNYTFPEHPRVLNIVGFNNKICRLIESFVRGSF